MISKTIGFRGTLFSDTPISSFQGSRLIPESQFKWHLTGNLGDCARFQRKAYCWCRGSPRAGGIFQAPVTGSAELLSSLSWITYGAFQSMGVPNHPKSSCLVLKPLVSILRTPQNMNPISIYIHMNLKPHGHGMCHHVPSWCPSS